MCLRLKHVTSVFVIHVEDVNVVNTIVREVLIV